MFLISRKISINKMNTITVLVPKQFLVELRFRSPRITKSMKKTRSSIDTLSVKEKITFESINRSFIHLYSIPERFRGKLSPFKSPHCPIRSGRNERFAWGAKGVGEGGTRGVNGSCVERTISSASGRFECCRFLALFSFFFSLHTSAAVIKSRLLAGLPRHLRSCFGCDWLCGCFVFFWDIVVVVRPN